MEILDIKKITCRLYDKYSANNDEFIEYNEPIYDKIEGIYGFITVAGEKVFFTSYSDDNIYTIDISYRYRVEYLYI